MHQNKVVKEDAESYSVKKLTQAIKYLSKRNNSSSDYRQLIRELSAFKREIAKHKVKVAVVSRSQTLNSSVKDCIVNNWQKKCSVTQLSLSVTARKIVSNYDIALLTVENINSLLTEEEQLIQKLISEQLSLAIVVVHDKLQQKEILSLEEKYQNKLNVFSLKENNLANSNSFFVSSSKKINSWQKLKLKRKAIQKIDRYFEKAKQKTWQQIKQDKDRYLSSKNPEQIQQIVDRLPHRCSRISQNYLKIFKQNNNQNKLSIVNPFLSDSLMHRVQNAVQDAEVIIQQTQQKTYLKLVYKQKNRVVAFHTYIIDICYRSLADWLDTEWQKISFQHHNGGLYQLQQQLQLELQPLNNLSQHTTLLLPDVKPQLRIENYVCLSALETNSRIDFDYHYTQSTWFRILIAIFVGASIYLLTQRLFGFILLLVQIINLLTGQDNKSVRLRQQTKEIKRIVDGKYQFLVRFLTDKMIQDIAIALDEIDRDYQEQIDIIIATTNQKLQETKQKINGNKERIETLKKVHSEIKKIFQD